MTPLIERIEAELARRKKCRKVEVACLVVGWSIVAVCVMAVYAMIVMAVMRGERVMEATENKCDELYFSTDSTIGQDYGW